MHLIFQNWLLALPMMSRCCCCCCCFRSLLCFVFCLSRILIYIYVVQALAFYRLNSFCFLLFIARFVIWASMRSILLFDASTLFVFDSDVLAYFFLCVFFRDAVVSVSVIITIVGSIDLCLCTSLFISIRFDECTGTNNHWNGRWLKAIKKNHYVENNCLFHIIILWLLISAATSLFVFGLAFDLSYSSVFYRFYESWWKRLPKEITVKLWKMKEKRCPG